MDEKDSGGRCEDDLAERLKNAARDPRGDRRPLLVIHKTGGVREGINLDKTSALDAEEDEKIPF